MGAFEFGASRLTRQVTCAKGLQRGAPRRGTGQQTDTSRLCVCRRTRSAAGLLHPPLFPLSGCPRPQLFTVCKHDRTTFQRRLHFTARELPTVYATYILGRVYVRNCDNTLKTTTHTNFRSYSTSENDFTRTFSNAHTLRKM